MIKRLRLKFIATNILLVTLVMLAAFSFIFVYTKNDLAAKSSTALHDIADRNYGGLEYLFESDKQRQERYPYLSTYVIEYNKARNVCYIDGFGDADNLTDEKKDYVKLLIRAVDEGGSNEGVLEAYNLRYYYVDTDYGRRIVLLDRSYEDDSLARLSETFFVVGGITLLGLTAISVFISGNAVKPVQRSIDIQHKLVSDISHELKTPITVISTNTDIVLSNPDSTVSQQKKWLTYIKDETARMSELITTMLYLARSDEDENAKVATEEADLSACAFEAALPFESICFENGKTYDIDIEPDVYIKCNVAMIKQLIGILLDNAVKYSNEGGRISLKVYSSDEKACISVFNTGEPVPKESLPHLFERFYRVDTSRSRERWGNGLGLSIAKRIIETNEGRISVSSGAETGTVFTCTFKKLKENKKALKFRN